MNKALLISLFVLLTGTTLKAQTYASNCTPTDTMRLIYRYDVARFALDRLNQLNSPWKDSIEIPVSLQDSIARSFYAVHNMESSLLKDTIMNLFGFRDFSSTFPVYELDSSHFSGITHPVSLLYSDASVPRRVRIDIMPGAGYAPDWAAGNYNNTSNSFVNSFLATYNITVQPTYNQPGYQSYFLVLPRPLNTVRIATLFSNSYTNAYAIPEAAMDGNSEKLVFLSDGMMLEYRMACGDCPSGCMYNRIWQFKVPYSQCDVQYLGATNPGFGFPPPPGIFDCFRGTIMSFDGFTLFNVQEKNGTVALKWKFEGEGNTSFVVERSADGVKFMEVSKLFATEPVEIYRAIDNDPLQGTSFYRIKAIESDGTSRYSPIERVVVSKSQQVSVYPNPVIGKAINVRLTTPAAQVELCLVSPNGQQVALKKDRNIVPSQFFNLSIPQVQPGLYCLIIIADGNRTVEKLIVE